MSGASSGAVVRRAKRFMPFSLGLRDCIGQNLARINYQTTVPMLLANFKFKLADEVPTRPLAPLPSTETPVMTVHLVLACQHGHEAFMIMTI
jgi:cytochrome P450